MNWNKRYIYLIIFSLSTILGFVYIYKGLDWSYDFVYQDEGNGYTESDNNNMLVILHTIKYFILGTLASVMGISGLFKYNE